MKRIIIIGVAMAMILSLPKVVLAKEEETSIVDMNDSVRISTEKRRQLGVEYSETVIKFYNVDVCRAFVYANNFGEILKTDGLILSEYYVIPADDGTYRYKYIVDDVVMDGGTVSVPVDQRAMKVLQENKLVTKISADIEVYATYYLTGETTYTGTAIYYKTNQGDYVYHSYKGEYLFPVKDFCEYQRVVWEEMGKYGHLDGAIEVNQLWDLSKYDIHSADFDISANGEMIWVPTGDSSQNQQPPLNQAKNGLQEEQPPQRVLWCFAGVGTLSLVAVGVLMFFRQRRRARS